MDCSARLIICSVSKAGCVRCPHHVSAPFTNFVANLWRLVCLGCFAALCVFPAQGQDSTNAPVVLTGPADQSVFSGQWVTFSVIATGAPPLFYQWRREGQDLPGLTNASATIEADITKSGIYEVSVWNSEGWVTTDPAMLVVDDHLSFRIVELSTNGVQSRDITTLINENKGGIALSADNIFLNGRVGTLSNPRTARIPLSTLGGGSVLPLGYDALVSNLRTETVYCLGDGSRLLLYTNFTLNLDRITRLFEVNGTNGLLTGNSIALSKPIPLANFWNGKMGFFSGYGRVVLCVGEKVYNIDLPSGTVLDIGNRNFYLNTYYNGPGCWGIAEYYGGSLRLVSVQDGYNIYRIRLPRGDGAPALSLPFWGLGTMPSISLSIGRSRWYGQMEGPSIFRPDADWGSENLFSAKVVVSTEPFHPPEIVYQWWGDTARAGSNICMSVSAQGGKPFHYQWFYEGAPIPNATNQQFCITDLDPEAEGNYWVQISNVYGAVSSSPGFLRVMGRPEIGAYPGTWAVPQGTNIDLCVEVLNAAPPVSVQWRRDGQPIPGATNICLWLTNLQPSQSGMYTLLASNRYGVAISPAAEIFVSSPSTDGAVFRIASLMTNDARVANAGTVLSNSSVYGVLAASPERLFFSGYDYQRSEFVSGAKPLADLSGGIRTPAGHRTLVSNLRSETVYTLAISEGSNICTALLEVDGTTGALMSNRVTLSTPIYFNTSTDFGLFSGWGRVVLLNGIRAYEIRLPSGTVRDCGPMAVPGHSWMHGWPGMTGVAEHFDGNLYLTYPWYNGFFRSRVPDGFTSTMTNFPWLGEMGAFTVSVPRGKWYFLHVYNSQFNPNQSWLGTLGSVPATFDISSGTGHGRFAFDPVAPREMTNVPFTVAIRALTDAGTVATNFNAQVFLKAMSVPGRVFLPTSPMSALFTNGVWSGTIAVLKEAPAAVLQVYDLDGNLGESNPFSVSPANDIGVSMSATPESPVIGQILNYAITVVNSGPDVGGEVRLTNTLPANVLIQEVTTPQGACYTAANQVWCELGNVAPSQPLTIQVQVIPTTVGTLTNRVVVVTAQPDPMPGNNVAFVTNGISLPALKINDVQLQEGDAGTNWAQFQVTLSTPWTNTVSVRFTTGSGSAVFSGTLPDFLPTNGVLVFSPGETNLAISVPVRGDRLYETNETFLVNLAAPTNATILDPQGIGTIIDDDSMPWVRIYDTGLVEGDTGVTNVAFRLVLSHASGYPVSVSFTTLDGTAEVGTDYRERTAVQTFAAGTLVLTQNLFVQVIGDAVAEPEESFSVQLRSVSNAYLSNTLATCVITNNDLIGTLDHFAWGEIPSPQATSAPVTITLTARDFLGNLLTNFSEGISLYAEVPQTSFSLLDLAVPSGFTLAGWATLGYSFTPTADLWVHALRAFGQNATYLWSDDGTQMLASGYGSDPEGWSDIPLGYLVHLRAGETYRVSVQSGYRMPYLSPAPTTFAHGHLGQAWISYGWFAQTFPDKELPSGRLYLADLVYSTNAVGPVGIDPAATTTFTNGTWSGAISILEGAAGVVLTAYGYNGPMGSSNPFDVIADGPSDTDMDGLPDDWEVANNLDPGSALDAHLDPDNDGLDNLAEFLAGTNPREAGSRLYLESLEKRGIEVRLAFRPIAGKTYTLERSSSLDPSGWTAVQTFTGENTNRMVVLDPDSSTSQAFYRIRLGQ